MFSHIIQAARDHWTPLRPKLDASLYVGHMTAWKIRSIPTILSYKNEDSKIRLQATVALDVQEDSYTFRDLLSIANAAYSSAKALFEGDHNLIIAQSNGRCPTHIGEISRQVAFLYDDFSKLINDETFYAAIKMSGAKFSGTPIDIWECE